MFNSLSTSVLLLIENCNRHLKSEPRKRSCAMSVLYQLSNDPSNLDAIVKSKAVPHLVDLLKDGDVEVIENAAGTLSNLTNNINTHAIIVKSGAVPHLIDLLKNQNATVMGHAQQALLKLGRNPNYKAALITKIEAALQNSTKEAYVGSAKI